MEKIFIYVWFDLLEHEQCRFISKSIGNQKDTQKNFIAFDIESWELLLE